MKLSRFAIYAWGVLGYNLLVILWGAYVRASGSGAGCGSHWPLCNGEIVPVARPIATIIEFSHRITTSISGLVVIGLVVWAFRALPRRHPARTGAVLSLVFIILEGLVGAVQVLLGLTADNDSLARAIVGSIHLANTFLMLAAMALTAWWASGGKPLQLRGNGFLAAVFAVGLIGALLVGASGAVTALGDTLFPTESLADGIRQDFSGTSHFLIQLRIIHPILAVLVGIYSVFAGTLAAARRPDAATKRLAVFLGTIFGVQALIGVANIALLAPVSMQLIHLLMADLVWIGLVLSTAVSLAVRDPATEAVTATERTLSPGNV